tara:strand:+ start:652 stop:1410 length:759 start_codon:yes stop_codon:yes gene_type:complete
MLLNVETGFKKRKHTHYITGEFVWRNHKTKKYTYQCDNPACGKSWTGKQRWQRKKLSEAKETTGQILSKHYCSPKCASKGQMTSSMVECEHSDCSKEFRKWFSSPKKYCSRECFRSASFLGGHTCKEDGCDIAVSKNNKSGYCKKHYCVGLERKSRKKLYAKLGNKCACCGERDEMYLSIDHINNDGHKLRKQDSYHTKVTCLLDYHRENPDALQILCSNCNHAKMRKNGELYIPKKFTRRKLQEQFAANAV